MLIATDKRSAESSVAKTTCHVMRLIHNDGHLAPSCGSVWFLLFKKKKYKSILSVVILTVILNVVFQDELRTETRKRNLLILIYHHLMEEG